VTLAFAVALDANVFLATPIANHNSVQWNTTKTVHGLAQTVIHRPFGFTSEVFYLALAVTLGSFFLMWNLRRTRTARAFLAIRDSEPTAIAFGINPTRYKLLAFCIGGAIAAAAGSIFAYLYINVDPTSFLFLTSVTFIGYAVITGIAELFGAVLVAFFFAILPQLTATPVSGVNQTIPLITGALLI